MNSPLVSIIIPVYNAEKWLTQTLESVINQTWQNIEVLVVDDGSQDESLAIALRYESAQIKVMSQVNQGASAARNHGLSQAQGDYIQYLDADDLLAHSKIAEQVKLLEAAPQDKLAICRTVHFLDGTDPETGDYYDDAPYYKDSDDPLDWLIHLLGGDGLRGMVQPAAWLTPRSVSERAGPWNSDLSLDDDGEYFSRVILESSGIRRISSTWTYYRKFQNGSSLSRTNSSKSIWSGLKALNLKAEQVLSRTQEIRAKKAIALLYMDWAMTAYPLCPEVTQLALGEIEKLAIKVKAPVFGGWRMALLQQLLGWKNARFLSWHFHSMLQCLLDKLD